MLLDTSIFSKPSFNLSGMSAIKPVTGEAYKMPGFNGVSDLLSALSAPKVSTSAKTAPKTQAVDWTKLMSGAGQSTSSSTTSNTQTTKQNASPELAQSIRDMQGKINTLGQDITSAYQNKAQTFNDVLRSLANLFKTQSSGNASAAGTSALSMGLSPLEASGAASEAGLKALQAYYPAMSQTEQQGADVGIEAQKAQAALLEALALPLQTNVISPYLTALAGQTTNNQQTTNTVNNNPAAAVSLMLQKLGIDTSANSDLAKLQESSRQFDINSGQTEQQLLQTALSDALNRISKDQAVQEATRQFDVTQQSGMSQFLQKLAQDMSIAQQSEAGANQRSQATIEAQKYIAELESRVRTEMLKKGIDIGKAGYNSFK